jgi:Ca2+-binding EF-hand superfamily protein
MSKVNFSQSGCIDYSEWMVATASQNELLTTDNLKMVFNFIDKKNTGFISQEDLATMMTDY